MDVIEIVAKYKSSNLGKISSPVEAGSWAAKNINTLLHARMTCVTYHIILLGWVVLENISRESCHIIGNFR